MKIVVNRLIGGHFSLSPLAIKEYLKSIGQECYFYKRVVNKGEVYVPMETRRETYCRVDIDSIGKKDVGLHDIFLTKDFGETLITEPMWANIQEFYFADYNLDREDANLIKIIEALGASKASSANSKLEVVEIPDGIEYYIEESNGGVETIHEDHFVW